MGKLGKLWAGRVYGTNTGNIFLELDEVEPNITGRLRLLDSISGISVYSVAGNFDDSLRLNGHWQVGGNAEDHGVLTIEGKLTSDGRLRGTWESTIGTGGTFELFPHDLNVVPNQGNDRQNNGPEQLYTRKIQLGAIRLYARDIEALLRYIKEEFAAPRPIVTYRVRGSEVAKYEDEFIGELNSLGTLDYLKLTIQEPDSHNLSRVVVVELNASGANELLVQGTKESWVVGRSEALASFLRTYQSNLVTTYKKFGLNINSLIFLGMLVAIPEIDSMKDRGIFVFSTVLLLGVLYWIHAKFIPNTSIFLSDIRVNAFTRAWPTILSWIIAVSATLVASLMFNMITNVSN